MKKFFHSLLMLTAVLTVISLLFARFAPAYLVSDALVFLPLMFFIITLLNKFIILKGADKKQDRLMKNYMLTIGIKFFLFIIILVVYSFLFQEDSIKFILSFFIFYLIYTIFDSLSNFKLFKSVELSSIAKRKLSKDNEKKSE